MWTDFFDKIYLINLERRTDRRLQATWELDKYGIPFEVWKASDNPVGACGIWESLQAVMRDALSDNCENILVFEDDIKFLHEPALIMQSALESLPKQWDLLYLGVNIGKSTPISYSDYLVKLRQAYALHACAYSRHSIKRIAQFQYNFIDPKPIDVLISEEIVRYGLSFATIPMLCTQRPSFSDIEGRHVDYSFFLENRFNEGYKKLKNSGV